jgi:UDP-3-O-[3-hydroxymyristoyl] glucosamine N-acyltransferase
MILYNENNSPLVAISYKSTFLDDLTIFLAQEGMKLCHKTPEEFFSDSEHHGHYINLINKDFELREKISNELDRTNSKRFSFVHHSSTVFEQSSIGPGVLVGPNSTIDKNVFLEKDIMINPQTLIGHKTYISHGCYVSPGTLISGAVKIGKFCYIGLGSVIIDNITICDYVRTGAATVVRKSIAEPGTYITKNQIEKLY